MMKYKLIIVFITLLTLLTNAFSIEPGKEVPKFTGLKLDGTVLKIEDFVGKPILIDFWASWCGPCRKEFPFLIELYKNNKDSGLIVIGINIDKKQKNVEKFIESFENKPEFPIIFDSESNIPPLFDISTMPTTVFIDKNGIIKYVHPGFTEDDKEEIITKAKEILSN